MNFDYIPNALIKIHSRQDNRLYAVFVKKIYIIKIHKICKKIKTFIQALYNSAILTQSLTHFNAQKSFLL